MTAGECPICLNVRELTREHVWPDWFLKRMDAKGAPPYGWSLNGVPIEDRRGNQIHGQERQRVMLDICQMCNGTMDTTIEKPAKVPVWDLAQNRWQGSRTEHEWRAVGLWWAKVLLLAGLIGTELSNPRLQKAVRLTFDKPMPDLRWLTDGSGIPNHVSVFAHNADMSINDTEHDLLIPAHVHSHDKSTVHSHVMSLATPGLCVAVVSHPGITIKHPMVERGQAWELLRSAPTAADLSHLQPLSAKHVAYIRGGGLPAGHVVDDSEYKSLITLVGYESEEESPLSPASPEL